MLTFAALLSHTNGTGAQFGAPIETPMGGSYGDSSLRSMVRACLETQASDKLRALTEHPKIQERLPGFKVSMGYGLHAGWAIEGAIGSMLKIDASYLSPHVNLAARLETGAGALSSGFYKHARARAHTRTHTHTHTHTGTHQFGVDILFSDCVYDMISPRVQSLCRKIDRVTVKGSVQPITLYTYDVPPCDVSTVEELYKDADLDDEDFDFWDYFRPRSSRTYRKRHADAVASYLEGNWLDARKGLELCLIEWSSDGASKVVLEFMRSKNFRVPDDWKGFRALTSK